jgi:hypothetical protein
MGMGATVKPNDFGKATVIVLSTPNWEQFSEFSHKAQKLFRPAWSEFEVDEARAAVPEFSVAALSDYKQRFRDLGGVPRWIFNPRFTHAEVTQLFRQAMPDGKAIYKLLKEPHAGLGGCAIRNHNDPFARLVMFEVDAEFQIKSVHWMSDTVGEWALDRLDHTSKHTTLDLLSELAENHARGDRSMCSVVFETHSHMQLAKGGTFKAVA